MNSAFDTAESESDDIEQAILRLYCNWLNTDQKEVNSRDINIYACDASWTDSESFTKANAPMLCGKILDVETTAFKSASWIEFDVTEYVKAHKGEKISFAILNEGTVTDENHIEFYSMEKAGYVPQLVIS